MSRLQDLCECVSQWLVEPGPVLSLQQHVKAQEGSAGLGYGIEYKFDYGIDGKFNLVVMEKMPAARAA